MQALINWNCKCICNGSCSFCILYNAFGSGVLFTDCGIASMLVGMNWLVKNSAMSKRFYENFKNEEISL